MATYGALLDALGDPTRRAIVDTLRSGPRAVVDLAGELPVSRPAVSQHLRVLHDAGLVAYRAEGNRNVYRLRPQGAQPLREWLDEFWQEPLERFREHVVAGSGAGAGDTEQEQDGVQEEERQDSP